MSWIYLMLAILFEVSGTTCMKMSQGFTKPLPTAGTVLLYVVSFTCLSWALKTLDVGLAYAIWAGLGTAAVATIGVVGFGESLGSVQVVCLVLIVVGVMGLNLAGGH
jgi:small multidrug resistance pump